MKSKTTKQEAATPSPKGKVKVNPLKLNKETIKNLSDHDAAAVKGGGSAISCDPEGCKKVLNHNETLVIDQEIDAPKRLQPSRKKREVN